MRCLYVIVVRAYGWCPHTFVFTCGEYYEVFGFVIGKWRCGGAASICFYVAIDHNTHNLVRAMRIDINYIRIISWLGL